MSCPHVVELFDTYGILHIDMSMFYFDLEDLAVIQSRSWYVDKGGYLTSRYYYMGQMRIVRFTGSLPEQNQASG